MSKIADEINLLDKLAWASIPVEIRIKKAAALLRKRGIGSSKIAYEAWARRELRRVTHLTSPGKGKILARDNEIKREISRQEDVRYERRGRDPYEPEPSMFSRYYDMEDVLEEDIEDHRAWEKTILLRKFGENYGVKYLSEFVKLGKQMLFICSRYGKRHDVRDIYLRRPDGDVYRIDMQGNWGSRDYMVSQIPTRAIGFTTTLYNRDKELEALMARAVLEGASVRSDFDNMQTIYTFPDGSQEVIDWNVELVEPEEEEEDDDE